ncbi:unnamed protein product [Lactuca virosa]|uniref:Uncharacterized protein n=1 Tax=Lactuca virosa TaxID=75947 RepID=A0AAU9M3R6_9ASTR|nr:unnamed protein product [Lactuca virosa]
MEFQSISYIVSRKEIMSDYEDSKDESLMEKIHDHKNSSFSSISSDSNDDSKLSSIKSNVFHLFGIEKLVHMVFGGGKQTGLNMEDLLRGNK